MAKAYNSHTYFNTDELAQAMSHATVTIDDGDNHGDTLLCLTIPSARHSGKRTIL